MVVVFQGKEITVRLGLNNEHLYVLSKFMLLHNKKRVYDIL